ncbi:PREDICTED: uncharacterized protein LOC109184306 [Ipomoea nil]|uniref:uncharacterized protein LOC109184306 n=1 Tax=Ipomoea nil TaxID=35883 RepID=UPI0009013683|nr:PREDICTED: uncharacterized protein LOC109184306 [Ipomoea nil]
MECVSLVEYFVLDQGEEIGHIKPERGLRQSDPISSYLFIIVTKGFNAMIRDYERSGKLHGISVARNAQLISHLFFADDIFIFFKANVEEAKDLRHLLQVYEKATGQCMNMEKSTLASSGNTTLDMRNRLGTILRIQQGSGMGREILMKTVLQAQPTYARGVFLMPKVLVKEVENVMNSYWWKGGGGNNRGINRKPGKHLYIPKKWGGLGVRNLYEFNLALLYKQALRLYQNPDSLVSKARGLFTKFFRKWK